MKKDKCKFCEKDGIVIISPFGKKEAKEYAEHLKHKHEEELNSDDYQD